MIYSTYAHGWDGADGKEKARSAGLSGPKFIQEKCDISECRRFQRTNASVITNIERYTPHQTVQCSIWRVVGTHVYRRLKAHLPPARATEAGFFVPMGSLLGVHLATCCPELR
jgi:hypothetical protein